MEGFINGRKLKTYYGLIALTSLRVEAWIEQKQKKKEALQQATIVESQERLAKVRARRNEPPIQYIDLMMG